MYKFIFLTIQISKLKQWLCLLIVHVNITTHVYMQMVANDEERRGCIQLHHILCKKVVIT
jgi:hypothetical protein